MTADPRGALSALVTAFERHLEASAAKRGEDDPTVVAAYDDLADAFAAYDDALLQAYGEMTPLDIYDGDEDDEDDEELDDHSDEDGDGVYSGLDDEDYEDVDEDEDERRR
ncbi:primosomal protein [Pedococcus sp. NPDC057267]|uniref:primosomal protein n=1 Tax=Pedococcus sp. NPDC057267 TaxID=3346077 RepID=UPI0036277A89